MDTLTAALPAFRLNGEEGVVIKGQFSGSFCFVPLSCLQRKADGGIELDRTRYLRGSWARKNVRFNPGRTVGSHLFPEAGAQPLPASPAVDAFLRFAADSLAG